MRRVYYRTFFASPVACWVDEPEINKKIGYKGEKRLFIFNNLHRYFLYAAMIIIVIKWWDVTHTLHFTEGATQGWGICIGTLVMGIEAFLLSMYVTSCHALRHLAGGVLDRWTTPIAKLRGSCSAASACSTAPTASGSGPPTIFVFLGDLWVLAVDAELLSDMVLFAL